MRQAESMEEVGAAIKKNRCMLDVQGYGQLVIKSYNLETQTAMTAEPELQIPNVELGMLIIRERVVKAKGEGGVEKRGKAPEKDASPSRTHVGAAIQSEKDAVLCLQRKVAEAEARIQKLERVLTTL